jgi:TolB-like protein/class 3 adenylate cyclase
MSDATHRLAAIMFTDIIGYSAMMGKNEPSALALLKKNKALHSNLISLHKGQLLKEIGDGILASFTSVSDAVHCAGALLRESTAQGIGLKIGIHEGEVVFQDDDVFGDGVNIASRIESISDKSGIIVSEAVYKNIKNKDGIKSEFIQEISFKNIEEPVRIYEVKVDLPETSSHDPDLNSDRVRYPGKKGIIIISISLIIVVFLYYLIFLFQSPVKKEGDHKSIAVLPFDDLSEKGNQQFFADGVMEDILGQLQKIEQLHVLSRTSVMKYRGDRPTMRQIQEELNVDYVLEGSVRRSPDEVMITAQLIDVKENSHLSSQNYTNKYSAKGIFQIQEQIAKRIVNDLKLVISPKKVAMITRAMTENTAAYEHFQKGRNYYNLLTHQGMDSAIVEFKKAIQIDPDFGVAYGILATAFWAKHRNYRAPDIYIDSTENYASKGLEVDENCVECLKSLAFVESRKYGNIEKANELNRKAMKINPNYGSMIYNSWHGANYVGDYELAFDQIKRLITIWPNAKISLLINQHLYLGNFEKAKTYLDLMNEQNITIESMNSNQSNNYTYAHFTTGDVTRFKNGSNRLFQTTGDSLYIHYSVFGSYWLENRPDELVSYYEEHINMLDNISPAPILWFTKVFEIPGASLLRLNKLDEASRLGSQILDKSQSSSYKYTSYFARIQALGHLLKNEKEQSISWLERAIERGYLVDIAMVGFYDGLKDHSRFQELVNKQQMKKEAIMALFDTYNFPEPEDLIPNN